MKKSILLIALALGLSIALLAGCGSKQPGAEADAGPDLAAALEPEADTGDAEYPEPPKNTAARNPLKFNVSVNKALVLPLSEDGKCWDPCSTDAKDALVDSLTQLSGDQFESAAKALTTVMGAKNSKEVLPDIYVYIDCGYGQTYTTSKSSAEDRLSAYWRGAKEVLKIDPQDSCAISVWDADEDGNDELLGDVVLQPIQQAEAGTLTIRGDKVGFGQVFLVELYLDQMEGESVWGGGGTDSTQPTQPGEETKPSPGSTPVTPPAAGASTYKVEVVKANLKKTKEDGQPWDAKIPFVAGGVLPDPFVEAYKNGYQSEHPFMETSVAQEKLYYEWRETGEVNLTASDKIHFMVWDKDKIDHDLMGECITGSVGGLKLGSEIVIRDCGQVDFLVVKITKK
jgi:hypothetical protein